MHRIRPASQGFGHECVARGQTASADASLLLATTVGWGVGTRVRRREAHFHVRSFKLYRMGVKAIQADVLLALPRRLRHRAQRMEHVLDRQHDEALHLMQDALLYLAGLAFADYCADRP